MKKIPAFALLVSLSALSSCQSIITREDACQILHEAASAVRAESFQLPRKVSFSSLYSRQFEKDLGTTNEKKEELITSLRVEFDEEAGKFFVGNYERHAETDRTYSRGVYYWLWKEDGKNHWVASNSEVDFARAEIEELDDESFAKRFQDLRETYIFDKETLAQDYEYVIETLQNIEKTENTITLGEIEATVEYSKNETKESYFSSKAGNLSTSFKKDLRGSFTVREGKRNNAYDLSIQEEWKDQIDGNLLKSFLRETKRKATSEASNIEESRQIEITYSWGSCSFTAPKIP